MCNVSFKARVSLLIFSLNDLSIDKSRCWSFPLLLCYCWFLLLWLLISALHIEVFLCWVHIYLQSLNLLGLLSWSLHSVFLCLFVLNSLLFDMHAASPAFFLFLFSKNRFSHPVTLSLYVFLDMRWISGRQHLYGSCFVYWASLCLWCM